MSLMFNKAFEHYDSFRENRLTKRRFSTAVWQELITEWSTHFAVRELGKTEEGRPIHEVKWGEGPIQVIAWSQMHGDEATATLALADIFRLLSLSTEFCFVASRFISIPNAVSRCHLSAPSALRRGMMCKVIF